MSRRHRKPTASAKKVAKIAFTAAGSQRADHAGSGGRSAGARADCPLSAMPVKAQYIVRAGVLAFALGVGAAVANTPAVAFAEPTDTSSSSLVVWFVVVGFEFVIRIRGKYVINGSDVVNRFVGLSGWLLVRFDVSGCQSSVDDAQASSTSSASDASTADPRSGVMQSSGGAHTGSTPSSSDTTASAGATPTQTGVPSAVAAASSDEPPAAASPDEKPTAASPDEQPAAAGTLRGAGAIAGCTRGGNTGNPSRHRGRA